MRDTGHLLVFNAGSSSLKFELFDCGAASPTSLANGAVRDIGRSHSTFTIDDVVEDIGAVPGAAEAASIALERLVRGVGNVRITSESLVATGHRVVHGGDEFSVPVKVTVSVFDRLKSLAHLAPLHNPPSLAVMEAVGERFPEVPLVAVFDTAFFRDLPHSVSAYAIPPAWSERYAIRRYGFHGIAHQYLCEQLAQAPRAGRPPGRAVTLHLGQGCSATALRNGRPVETSMGFTPLEGLVMGTRSGDVDAGVLLHLARQGHSWKEIEEGLNRRSGLFGLSEVSDDMRELLELETQQHRGARLALAAFYHRVHKYLGAYAAVLGGIEAIAFGGGIGENSPVIRARICAGLHWLGLEIDAEANASCVGSAARISTDLSAIEVRVIPVNEEPIIAAAALSVLEELPAR